MIAGHLQIKNDNYYMVLNYTDATGNRRQPWIPTGLPAKGNKRRAEKLLLDTRKSFVPPVVSKENEDISSDMLFADYMELWLEIIRSSVEKTTFSSYTQMVKGKIAPYFRNTGLTLDGIQAKHIQSFYLHELKTVSPGTVIHYHANIHKALKYAVKMDLIPFNPADKVERPKKQRYIADYYRQEELEKLLALREQQKENRRVCGNCYSKKYDGYVFVDAMGNIFNPRSVTANFSKLLEQNGLRHIRFHDLRHSCASLLLANDVPLKQIQEWLGHSDIGTTANIYSHLDYKSKITSANVMDNILTLPDTRQTGWHT